MRRVSHRCMASGRRSAPRSAFTLVELLVAIGIIAVLVGILLPVLARVNESARRTKCASNLRQLAQGLFMYANVWHDRLPNLNPPLTWSNYQGANDSMVHFADSMDSPAVFHCPSDRDPIPQQILTADQTLPDSGRVSYDFFNLYFAPEFGPKLNDFRGKAPLAWDLEGGSTKPDPLQNHGTEGGNVVFADGHVLWTRPAEWEGTGWPQPASDYYPLP